MSLFKLESISLSMENDSVEAKNAERLTKDTGRMAEGIGFYQRLRSLA
jgi:hypothetical protein